jgi:hypothetical protein
LIIFQDEFNDNLFNMSGDNFDTSSFNGDGGEAQLDFLGQSPVHETGSSDFFGFGSVGKQNNDSQHLSLF